MEIILQECQVDLMKGAQVDLLIFSHPNYFLFHEDMFIGHLFSDYQMAFCVFEMNYN